MTGQPVFEHGDDDGHCEDSEAEEDSAHPAVLGAACSEVADRTDDAGAGVTGPVEFGFGRGQQDRDADNDCNCRNGGQLNHGSDAIGPGELTIVHEATGNAEREHMRECQTESGAPYQSEDVPGDGRNVLQGGNAAIRQMAT